MAAAYEDVSFSASLLASVPASDRIAARIAKVDDCNVFSLILSSGAVGVLSARAGKMQMLPLFTVAGAG
jgi:hypothetical protein